MLGFFDHVVADKFHRSTYHYQNKNTADWIQGSVLTVSGNLAKLLGHFET